MSSEATHIQIAKRHSHFISFVCQIVEVRPDKCEPKVFCTWVVVASYYRAIHLIEAVFAKMGQNHVLRETDANARRNGLLRKLGLFQIMEEYRILRRFAKHAKYFPDNQVADYDIITQLDQTRAQIVQGYLARIEQFVAAELGVTPDDLN